MSGDLDSFNKSLEGYIVDTSFSVTLDPLITWRDKAIPGSGDAWGRRFTIILPMALIGIIGIIDALVSVCLGVFTSPAELCGVQISRNFFIRAGLGVTASFFGLTVLQYYNMCKDSIAKQFPNKAKASPE